MLRYLLVLIAAATLTAGPLPAQFREPTPYTRVSITPVLGYRFGYTARVEATVYTQQEAAFAQFEEERGGGHVVGGEAQVHVTGPLGVYTSALYATPADNRVLEDGYPPQDFTGPAVWFASAGITVQLPEPMPDYRRFPFVSSLQVGPAIVREVPRQAPLPPDHPLYEPTPWRAINHLAINAGLQVNATLGSPNVALHVTLHDFVTFWNERAVADQLQRAYREQLGLDVTADYRLPVSHQFQARAGISFRF
jgi:hypothetical protein